MNIHGQINLFVTTRNKDGNTFKTFRGTLASKKEDGHYENMSVDIIFDKENFPAEKLAKFNPKKMYALDIKEGFIGVRSYTKEDKRIPVIYLYVQKAELKDSKEIQPKEANDNDLPF